MRFSILIPAYKLAYFKECIDSILAQTYQNFEIVVVNDSSPENLDSIVLSYDDRRIRYFKNEKNCGAIDVVDNWNKCLSYATGDYVICMGDDDKLLPCCLEEYSKLIDKYPGIGLVHGWTEIINERSEITSCTTHRCEYESAISLMWHRQHAYEQQFIGDFCFQRECLIKHGGFYKLPLAWGSDDISALIAASENGVANTQTVVFQYRINSQTITNNGNIDLKLQAIEKEINWKKAFLSTPVEGHTDKLYKHQLLKDIDGYRAKKQGLNISADLRKHSVSRIFYWWRKRNLYNLEFKTLVYAFIQAHK